MRVGPRDTSCSNVTTIPLLQIRPTGELLEFANPPDIPLFDVLLGYIPYLRALRASCTPPSGTDHGPK